MFLFLQEIIQYVLQQIRRFKKWKQMSKKGFSQAKGIPVLCLAFYFAVYILFPQYLGEVADFCPWRHLGEKDFWGRKYIFGVANDKSGDEPEKGGDLSIFFSDNGDGGDLSITFFAVSTFYSNTMMTLLRMILVH